MLHEDPSDAARHRPTRLGARPRPLILLGLRPARDLERLDVSEVLRTRASKRPLVGRERHVLLDAAQPSVRIEQDVTEPRPRSASSRSSGKLATAACFSEREAAHLRGLPLQLT
jgi:hypothetical protein